MSDNPFLPLTYIAGPAILTNACATLLNSATLRYHLAIPQWREFRASLAAGDRLLADLYAAPERALRLAERRLRLLLRGLDLLYAALAGFGAATLLGLAGAVAAAQELRLVPVWLVPAAGAAGLLALLSAMALFALEIACARALLQLQVAPRAAALPGGQP
ncbi:DUF2721 domain-containing protein [Phenylobacterium sp.]|uniref:DUF2721 domain-containing protein n=1 Tax=Phenylobacterium sp. TaxID=1871053 RepID=UPI0035B05DA2